MTGAYTGEELDRAIETAAINAIIASQIFHGRGNLPWLFADTHRKREIAKLLVLDSVEAVQATTEHYGIVAATQAPQNAKLDAISKLLDDEIEHTVKAMPKKVAA